MAHWASSRRASKCDRGLSFELTTNTADLSEDESIPVPVISGTAIAMAIRGFHLFFKFYVTINGGIANALFTNSGVLPGHRPGISQAWTFPRRPGSDIPG